MNLLRICLVAPGHVSTTPRVVREADALASAGHDVRVVALRRDPVHAQRDDDIARTRTWRIQYVDVSSGGLRSRARWLACVVAERVARAAVRLGVRTPVLADQALSRYLIPFVRAIGSEPADIVIGRGLSGMAATLRGARSVGARAGFDMEDLHSGELPDSPEHDRERTLREQCERRYLPRFELLSAASGGIADEVTRRYHVKRPRVILNAFPLADRAHPSAVEPRGELPSLYWFSQALGPDRGLDDALQALALMDHAAELFLRGSVDSAFRTELLHRATALGVAERVHLLPLAPPEELVALAMQHDVGLALEQPVSLNRMLCASNKLLLYLAAGIPVAATDTPGQRPLLEAAPDAGFLYPPGAPEALARGLDDLLSSAQSLQRAKAAALRAAEERFCWDLEQRILVAHVAGAPTSRRGQLARR